MNQNILLVVVWGGFIALMYFFMIRPQRKRRKEEEKMRNSIQVGDEVVTIGGISGRVVAVKEDSFVIESLIDRSKISFEKWALQKNKTVHDDVK
ncbi:MAG: preprotein translocase subunit YajC [bacterium]|nr:preprotein translocase subunit YajC [bacterium]